MLHRKKQQLIIYVVLGVMLGGFMLIRYLPLNSKIKACRARCMDMQKDLDKIMMQKQALPVVEEKLEELRAEAANYEKQVPKTRSLGDFLQQIADLMNEHNLRRQIVEPGKEVESKELTTIPVNVKCQGRLQQLFAFYKSLQSLDRFVRIEDFKLVNRPDLNGDITMQTKIVIYYQLKAGQG